MQERTEGSQEDSRPPQQRPRADLKALPRGPPPPAVPAPGRPHVGQALLCQPSASCGWDSSPLPPPPAGPRSSWTHPSSGRGLYQPVIEGQRLHDGGVGLGPLLELLQRQLPVGVLQAERQRLSGRGSQPPRTARAWPLARGGSQESSPGESGGGRAAPGEKSGVRPTLPGWPPKPGSGPLPHRGQGDLLASAGH